MFPTRRDSATPATAALVGVAAGVLVLSLYVVGGLVVVGWGVAEFFARLTPGILGSLALATAVAVAVVAVPVAAYLGYGLASPLAVLALAVVGWLALGWAQGALTARTVFGLAVYAMYLSPVYLALYAALGWIEHRLRG